MNKSSFLKVILGALLLAAISVVVLPVRSYMRALAEETQNVEVQADDSDITEENLQNNDDNTDTTDNDNNNDQKEILEEPKADDDSEKADKPESTNPTDMVKPEESEPEKDVEIKKDSELTKSFEETKPTEIEEPLVEEVPEPSVAEELKKIAQEDYKNYYKRNSKLDDESVEVFLNEIVDIILKERLYTQSNQEELLKSCRNNAGYIINIIKSAYNDLYSKKYLGSQETFDNIITGGVSTDFSSGDYVGYEKESGSSNVSLVPGYVNNLQKKAAFVNGTVMGESIDKFRQYAVTLGMNINSNPESQQVNNADIIIMIDNSASMNNNLDNAKAAAKQTVDSVFTQKYNSADASSAKIAVLSFTNYTKLVCDFTNNRNDLIKAIDSINKQRTGNDVGKYGTNIQDALLYVKDKFGLDDNSESVSKDRKKIVVLFSDGVPTTRTTDIWTYKNDVFDVSSISLQSGNKAENKTKRWSFLTTGFWKNGEVLAETISLPDGSEKLALESETGANSTYVKQKDFNSRVTALEAQFMVYQGVELYTVAYTDNNDSKNFMDSMTEKLKNKPDFISSTGNSLTDYQHNPLGGYDISGTERQFGANNVLSFINKILSSYSMGVENKFTNYEITEELVNEFDFSDKNFIISKKPFGEQPINDNNWKKVTFDGKKLTWRTPEEFDAGTYYITYNIKASENQDVFPNGADKNLYGANALDKVGFSKNSKVFFKDVYGNQKNIAFENVRVSVQPHLQLSLTSGLDLVLFGEKTDVKPVITSGTGLYKYKFTETSNGEGTVNIKSEDKFKPANACNVDIGTLDFSKNKETDYKYTFEVYDLISLQTKRVQITIANREPKLKINIVDQNGGKNIDGVFETRIVSRDLNDSKNKVYYLSGLGTREYKYSAGDTFLKRGTDFDVKTYVPFGYKIIDIYDTDGSRDGNVKIDILRNGSKISNFEQEVTVKVQKESNPKYFFDWTWIIDAQKGSIAQQG